LSGKPEQVAIERAAQALISAYQYDRAFPHLARFEQGMAKLMQARGNRALDIVEH
jgi:hypothetical protein